MHTWRSGCVQQRFCVTKEVHVGVTCVCNEKRAEKGRQSVQKLSHERLGAAQDPSIRICCLVAQKGRHDSVDGDVEKIRRCHGVFSDCL